MDKQMMETDNSGTKRGLWFTTRTCCVGLGVIAAIVTIVLAIARERELAIAAVIVGVGVCTCCEMLRYYFNKINQYVLTQKEAARKHIESSEEHAKEQIVAIEKQAKERIVGVEKEAEERIAAIEKEIEVREAAVLGLHKLAIACAQRDDFVNSKTAELHDEIIEEVAYFQSIYGSGDEFLYEVSEHIANVFRPLLPSTKDGKPVRLWTGVRLLNEQKNEYITIMRSSDCSRELREERTITLPVDRGIAKLVSEKYKHDGKGVVILSRKSHDHFKQPNDELGENESMMAAPIVIGTKIPMIVVLNSSIPNSFDERFEPYMVCCASIFMIALKNMLKSLK